MPTFTGHVNQKRFALRIDILFPEYDTIPWRRILDRVFSVIHYLPQKKKTDNEGSPAAANTNITRK